MISFVIPAHNEESVLGQTLEALRTSAEALAEPFEVLVVDDASSDRTAEIARRCGAVVVPVDLRKIGAVRNAGARAAKGDLLIFVDADTLISKDTLIAVAAAIRAGAVGGGARVRLDRGAPRWARVFMTLVVWSFARIRLAAGCFLFARREDFHAVGGFDESYYASEEIHLSLALKTRGPFVVVGPPVVTSARKARMFSGRQLLRQTSRIVLRGRRALKQREGLDLWYDGRRESKPSTADSPEVGD